MTRFDRFQCIPLGKLQSLLLYVKRLSEDIQLRNFSPHTVEAYVRAVAHFSRHFGRSPEQLSGERVHEYLLYLSGICFPIM